MSDVAAQNRFAPPRADVEDQPDSRGRAWSRPAAGTRFLAVLIDGVLPIVIGIVIGVAIAIPAYERYKQEHVPGIDPPALGSGHHLIADRGRVLRRPRAGSPTSSTASCSSTSTARPSASG